MEKKIELQVLNITNSKDKIGAFAMLLGEVDGERQLPIIIGPSEAQATALYLKGVKTPRPLTHDLFMTSLSALGTILLRTLIYKAQEGVFYSFIYLKKEENIIRIDARTSDAIALAVRAECPIFIYDSILEQERLRMFDTGPQLSKPYLEQEDENEPKEAPSRPPHTMTLQESLAQAIKDEDYELAARIRDIINTNKKNR